jgi:hypothetical protein
VLVCSLFRKNGVNRGYPVPIPLRALLGAGEHRTCGRANEARRSTSSSAMIAHMKCAAQGQMSQRRCGKLRCPSFAENPKPGSQILSAITKRDISVSADWSLQTVGWAADGKAVFVTVWTPKAFFLARADLAGPTQVLKNGGVSDLMPGIAPSPDGRYLAFGAETSDSNVWLLESF